MLFSEALEIRPGLTAVMGSGGKTSLLRVLAQELSHRGTVLVSTTTRIMRPNWCPFAATAAEHYDIRLNMRAAIREYQQHNAYYDAAE